MPDLHKVIKLYVKENEVELQDSLLPINDPIKTSFLSVDKVDFDVQTTTDSKDYLHIAFVLDPNKDSYQRVVFSFFDMFGMIGGVFELLKIGVGVMVGIVAQKVLMFSVLSRLYYTELDYNETKKVMPEASQEHMYTFTDNQKRVIENLFHVEKARPNMHNPTFVRKRTDDSQSHTDISIFEDEKEDMQSKARPKVLKTLREIMQNRRKFRAN